MIIADLQDEARIVCHRCDNFGPPLNTTYSFIMYMYTELIRSERRKSWEGK